MTPDLAGVWFGVDVGTVRVGVARSDPAGILASPVATLARDPRGDTDLSELAALVAEFDTRGVVVGLPLTLRGQEGPAARMAREYAGKLADLIRPICVEYIDERLTTVTAQRKLSQSGVRGAPAKRAVVDQAAAVELLQNWLDRRQG